MTNNFDEKLFIELGVNIPPDKFKRNIIVQNTPEAIQEHRDKYSNTDVFATAFKYDNQDIRNANQSGALYFDFDGQEAQEEINKVIEFLLHSGCPEVSIHIFFSGNKGFHLEVSFEALGVAPSKELNKTFGVIAKDIKKKLELQTLDTVIYDSVRLWRLPNSINGKSGLYKIPLYLEELSLPLVAIKEMAQTPRLDFEYPESQLWKEFSTIYEEAKTIQLQVYEVKEPLRLKEALGIEEGSRDNKMLSLAESLLSRNYNEQEVWETMAQVNKTYKPPLDDNSMSRIFRQATNYILSKKSSATNDNNSRGVTEMSQVTRLNSTPATNVSEVALSQETNKYGMPEPILLSEISSETNTVEWIWEGFIARGHKTLLSSLWKAGKSTFIGLLLKALEHGNSFAGQRTIPCNVLILTEESRAQWAERRDELNLQSGLYILSNPLKYKLAYRDWVGWNETIKKFCKEKQIELVIIDTISEFWSVNDENKAPEVTQALMPLNYLTEDNIGVLLVHHFRKSGGTQGTAARGSGALGSKVDIMIDFTRYEDDEQTTKRKLSCLSRFDETPREIILDFVNGEYIVLGNSTEVQKKEKLTHILNIFSEYPNGFTVKEVWENWDSFEYGKKPSKRTIQRYIADLIEKKQIEKIEDKEVGGKLIPFYAVTTCDKSNQDDKNSLSRVNEANMAKQEKHPEAKITCDKTTEGIDICKNVAGVSSNERPLIFGEQPQLIKPCYICKNNKFWKTKFDTILCTSCHPPVVEEDVKEWIGI